MRIVTTAKVFGKGPYLESTAALRGSKNGVWDMLFSFSTDFFGDCGRLLRN